MQVRVKKGDVIWSYLSVITTMSTNIVVIPFVVYYLSGDMLGLWYVFGSFGAIAHLFDFGFTSTFARNITYCWSGARSLKTTGVEHTENKEPDFFLMKNILQTSRRVYFIIAFAILFLMLTVGLWYINHLTKHIIGYSHIIAYLGYTIGVFLNMYYNYYDSFLRGVGAVKNVSKNRTIAKMLQISTMIISLVLGAGIIGVSTAYVVFGLTFRTLCRNQFYKYQGIGDKLGMVKNTVTFEQSKNMFKTIWFNAWREGLIQISMYCGEQVSVFICSIYLSLQETGVYSLGLQIANAVATISCVLYSTYQPSIQSSYLKNDWDSIRQSMSIIVVSFISILFLGILGTIFIGIPILRYIKPSAVVSIPILLGIFINQFNMRFRNCYSSYFSCTNRLIYMKSFIIGAILCLVLSFIFMGWLHWGVWGLISAQIISQIIFNIWYWPIKAHKEMNMGILQTISLGVSFIYSKTLTNKGCNVSK